MAKKLGISRQTLHKHLRMLVEEKLIHKNGPEPHVVYSAVQHQVGGQSFWIADRRALLEKKVPVLHSIEAWCELLESGYDEGLCLFRTAPEGIAQGMRQSLQIKILGC